MTNKDKITHKKLIVNILASVGKASSAQSKLIGIILILGLGSLLFLVSDAYAVIDDGNALVSIDSALAAINDAESIGADTAELEEKLNTAIGMIDQSETSKLNACSSDDCISDADKIIASVRDDANVLRDEAIRALHTRMIFLVGSTIVSAFASAFTAIYTHNRWKSFQLKRFLNMEIQER